MLPSPTNTQITLYRATGLVEGQIWLQTPHSLQHDLVLVGSGDLCKQSVFLGLRVGEEQQKCHILHFFLFNDVHFGLK